MAKEKKESKRTRNLPNFQINKHKILNTKRYK